MNGEGGCGHVKMKALSVRWKHSDEHVFVQTHAASSTCPNTLASNTVQVSAVQETDFRHVPQPRITRVFQNPRHASTMNQVCDGSTGGNNFGRARSVLSLR